MTLSSPEYPGYVQNSSISIISSNSSRLLQDPKINLRHAPATEPSRFQDLNYAVPVRMLRYFSRRFQRAINAFSRTVDIVHGFKEAHDAVLDWMFTSCRLGHPVQINIQGYTFYRFAHIYDAATYLEVPTLLQLLTSALQSKSKTLLAAEEISRVYTTFPRGHVACQLAARSLATAVVGAWQAKNKTLFDKIDDFLRKNPQVCHDVHVGITSIIGSNSRMNKVYAKLGDSKQNEKESSTTPSRNKRCQPQQSLKDASSVPAGKGITGTPRRSSTTKSNDASVGRQAHDQQHERPETHIPWVVIHSTSAVYIFNSPTTNSVINNHNDEYVAHTTRPLRE